MTKYQLAALLARKLHISTRRALFLVDSFFEALKELLIQGKNVSFQNFGTFLIKELSIREIYHPGERRKKRIGSRRRVYFKASPKLLSKINDKN